MKLRTRLIVYLGALHALLAALTFEVARDGEVWLLLALEGVIVLSAIAAWRLVRGFFVPLELIRTGAELIQERDFTSRFQPIGQPEMDRLIEVYNRMIDQLRTERLKVREKNELLDRIVEASPGGIVICDLDGRIAELNPSAARFLGADEKRCHPLLGRRLDELGSVVGEELSELAVGASRVLALPGGRRLRCRRAEFRDRGFPRSFYLLEELTEELRRTEKAAYGKLIRMMSHEVNNSVASVSSLLESARSFGEGIDPADRPDFDRALAVAVGRMESLGRFMNGFAEVVRLPPPELRPCDVEALLDDVLTLYAPTFAEHGLRLERQGEGRLGTFEVDKNQLEQVLMNVLKNAVEAIDTTGSLGGTIIVRTKRDGFRAILEIEDTGRGLEPGTRGELFTPFFTTKADGRGLGLMIVKEILDRHEIPFALDNVEGGGARFRCVLGS